MRASAVPSRLGALYIDVDPAPFSLAESDHAQDTTRHVADEDRAPDFDRFKCSRLLKNKADAERDYDLRDDRNIKRALRITRTLKSTCVCQCDRDKDPGERENAHQLGSDLNNGCVNQTKDRQQLRRKEEEKESDENRSEHPKSSRDMHCSFGSIRISGSEVLSGDRRGRTHQTH